MFYRNIQAKSLLKIIEKVIALLLVGLYFPAIYGSLPFPKHVIESISAGEKVYDLSPDPKYVTILAVVVLIPTVLILQWWKRRLAIAGWIIWAILITPMFTGGM